MNLENFKNQVNKHFSQGIQPYEEYVNQIKSTAKEVRENMKDAKEKDSVDVAKNRDEEEITL
jgi:hypothetical protein